MLDPRRIRSEAETLAGKLAKKKFTLDVAYLGDLDARRKEIQLAAEALQNERNSRSKEIGKAKQEGRDVSEILRTMSDLKSRLEESQRQLQVLQDEFRDYLLGVPNVPADEVPEGDGETANRLESEWGHPPQFDFPVKDHVEIGAGLAAGTGEALDFAAASRMTGARFVVMQGPVARLHRALGQFMLDLHVREHGYTEINVPFIVNADSLVGTGQLPKFAEDQFKLQGKQDFYLIPTAEVPVTNMVQDQILDAGELPARWVCHTPCFRQEAGGYGVDTRGMIRQHQFEKVELVQITRPEDSAAALEELTGHAERVLQLLELPYRKVALCGGDLGFSANFTYDLEVWLPSQQCYREISSCSNFDEFQARRMQARWRNPASGKPEFVHTLNGSGLAIGRTLVAILENCQDAEGRVGVPRALRPYMDGVERLE
ncbi:MAG: serine--tRNA ligase [Gammaproteobacteria bacterium]|nr:serine--tRNA ligase [Gammaproteobacteria bacterium]MYH86808.1 serine--tRNA ligase [Gammaproteobacteria bacterium]